MSTQQHSSLFRYEAQGKDSFGFVLASAVVYVLRAPDGKKTRIHLTNQDALVVMDDISIIVDRLEKGLMPNFEATSGPERVSPVVSFAQVGNDAPGFVVGRMITHLSRSLEGKRNKIHLVNREFLQTTEDLISLTRKFEKSLLLTGGQMRLTELEFKPNDRHHRREF